MTRDAANTWERHGQTVIAALILAAIIWVGKSVTDLSGTMGVVLNRLSNLEQQISLMDERFDRYNLGPTLCLKVHAGEIEPWSPD